MGSETSISPLDIVATSRFPGAIFPGKVFHDKSKNPTGWTNAEKKTRIVCRTINSAPDSEQKKSVEGLILWLFRENVIFYLLSSTITTQPIFSFLKHNSKMKQNK